MKKIFLISLCTFTFSLFTYRCEAQYTELYSFVGFAPSGLNPYGSVLYNSGLLYGMTSAGGANGVGTIFSIDTNGNNYTDLFDFNNVGTDGFNPYGSLIITGNKLYGMVRNGGNFSAGNIFSVNTNGSGYTDIWDFELSGGTNGAQPFGSLTLSAGVLYGLTMNGGLNELGNIFSVDTDGSNYANLLSFNGTNGQYPEGSLILSGNTLYGMASGGGANSLGLVFSITTSGSGFTDLLDFDGANGATPYGDVTLSGNELFGMTSSGGFFDYGVIFSVSTSGTGFKDVEDFFSLTLGQFPIGNLTLSGSTLYGMADSGGANSGGTLFSIDSTGTGLNILYPFSAVTGEHPFTGSLAISGNVLYGMTEGGGAVTAGNYDGVIFGLKDIALGVDNTNAAKGLIEVYPNPTTGSFNVSGMLQGQVIEVYNYLGQMLSSSFISQSVTHVDISSKSDGLYLIRIKNRNGTLVAERKIMKIK
jgi:uncharacterized repeat protein (TIGR03803 family)